MGISKKPDQSNEDTAEPERLEIAAISLCMSVNPKTMVEATKDEDYDEENGWTTPTSPSSKIPRMLQCPPAPRRKRKSSSPIRCCNPKGQTFSKSFPEEL
ncbi:hypothetical protein F511_29551 [Dorcoceras hygrometricum]|uniref:Uncharacterized protein n=1 Tax=Dorcoceras hygrometricum TaxID=472368 RepID=A0A2Z7DEU1_9LAMI|nr:hypothetical protein F511_29551 [Dorcoceras hygrometricum]